MYNPLLIAGAMRGRRRFRVGAEFSMCPDGTWVKGNATAEKCGTVPTNTGGWGPGNTIPSNYGGAPSGGYGSGPRTPPDKVYTPPYTPPTGTGGGGMPPGGYNPPGGGSGGMPTPPVVTDIPVTVPGPGCAPPVQVCPENQRRYVMPFNPDSGYTNTVAAGATTRFVGRPQSLFQPDRLIIASSIAPYFDIVSLEIGNVPQSLSAGSVAADIYSEVATDMLFNFKQAYPGLDVIITARNKSSITQTFQAQLAGFAVSQG